MAGTLFGIPLSQPVNINGVPLVGNLLTIYLAGTNTPASTFQDFGLTILNPNPIVGDASGRIPAFWVADGTYRARLTDSTGVLVYDIDRIQSIGPSTGTVGGGGGGIDPTTLFQTGDPLWLPFDGTRAGWVRLNARTIGSASSGAVERANADTQALYLYIWNNFSNSLCPVTGGRGGTALADFTANKPMATLDMRGCGAFGMDTMGNSAAGVITGATSAAATFGGQSSTALLAHTHGSSALIGQNHNHNSGSYKLNSSSLNNGNTVTRGLSFGTDNSVQGGGGRTELSSASFTSDTLSISDITVVGVSGNSGNLSITGNTDSAGTGASFSLLNPMRVGTWYQKL